MNITRSDGCSDAIAISTGLHFGGSRFTELYVRNMSSNGGTQLNLMLRLVQACAISEAL